MTTLNSDWQLITQSGGYDFGWGTEYIRLYAKSTENITGNYSTVSTEARVYVTNRSISVDSWDLGLQTGGASGGSTTWSAGETTLGNCSFTVNHNADGTGTAQVGMNFSATFGVTSFAPPWSYPSLQTIPRASQPSLSTSSIECNGSNGFTIYTNRASSSFLHHIVVSFGSHSWTYDSIADSMSFTPPTVCLDQIPNSTSGTGTVSCTTYSGSTKIGDTKTVNFTLTANSWGPTISDMTVTEKNTLVGNVDYTISGKSKKVVSANVSIRGYSSLASAIVYNNGTNVSGMVTSSQPYTSGEFTSNSGNYVIEIIDSRGLKATATINQTEYKYYELYVASSSLTRTAPTESTGNLSVNGKWFNLASNTISLESTTITDNNTGVVTTIAPTFSVSGSSFTISAGTDIINMLTYTDSFTVTCVVNDYYGSSVTITVSISSAEYTIALGKKTVRIKGDLSVSGKIYGDADTVDGLHFAWSGQSGTPAWVWAGNDGKTNYVWRPADIAYPVGSIYLSVNGTSPASIFGGSWTLLTDRFLIGAGNSYGVNSTGGSDRHYHRWQVGYSSWCGALTAGTDNGLIFAADLHSGGWRTSSSDGGIPGSYQGYNSGLDGGISSASETRYSVTGFTSDSLHMPPYLAVYMWKRVS